jgi:hypothetical protein
MSIAVHTIPACPEPDPGCHVFSLSLLILENEEGPVDSVGHQALVDFAYANQGKAYRDVEPFGELAMQNPGAEFIAGIACRTSDGQSLAAQGRKVERCMEGRPCIRVRIKMHGKYTCRNDGESASSN